MKYLLLIVLLLNLCMALVLYSEEQRRQAAEAAVPSLPGGRLVLLSEVDLPAREAAAAEAPSDIPPSQEEGVVEESPDSGAAEERAPDESLQAALAEELARDEPAEPTLASDLEPEASSDPDPDPEPAPAPVIECATLGPFVDEEGARRAVRMLTAAGAKVSWRSVVEQLPSGYRVFLEPYESTERAYQVAADLREQGVKDNFVITNPKDKVNGISLGLFTQKRGALKRLARLRNLGYQASIEMRYRDGNIQWVDYRTPLGTLDEPLLRELTEGYEDVQLIERYCE
ncbi:sporulation and cell division repeat protein [gamma proteobacterium HTCC5015]|nr:sporulation and cell division repeat protein [gamma proteobacterium HTCC5015]